VTSIREALRTGTVAGLAMIPFAAVFRASGLRINEYGAKTLALLVGEVAGPVHFLLTFVQHLVISWIASVPLLLAVDRVSRRRDRALLGLAYGAAFYVAVNSLALPFAFGDPTPWQLGFETVYPSLVVHLVYGFVVAVLARPGAVFSKPSRPPAARAG
jgi:uncharacterized membrane protein YagU involved in acid resistance